MTPTEKPRWQNINGEKRGLKKLQSIENISGRSQALRGPLEGEHTHKKKKKKLFAKFQNNVQTWNGVKEGLVIKEIPLIHLLVLRRENLNHITGGLGGAFLRGGTLMGDRDVCNQGRMGGNGRPQVAGACRSWGIWTQEVRQG